MKAMSSIMGDREAEGGASVLNPGEGVSLGLSAIADTSRSDMQRIYAAKISISTIYGESYCHPAHNAVKERQLSCHTGLPMAHNRLPCTCLVSHLTAAHLCV